ncbi:reticulon-like protein B21 isoform X1 [Salvia divinorum]|uniref:Reticulon-like protein n=1 Tax=Salvia divinorum TaxID=28513 RepID=A0ABD1FRG1_SALDI
MAGRARKAGEPKMMLKNHGESRTNSKILSATAKSKITTQRSDPGFKRTRSTFRDENLGIIESRHEADEPITITNNADHDLKDEVGKEIEVEETGLEISLQEQKPVVEEEKSNAAPLIVEEIPNHDHEASTRLESFADLIMWRDTSRSAFIFGVGAFAIISSSYTEDFNISCISLLSYLSLLYLAVTFVVRSLRSRGNISRDEEYVIGEEEAVWLIKMVLPHLNDFLSKLRSLFSGDPATTMKLAVVLFVLARCGGSITIWKMTKLGFFGVFVVPKLSSAYSSQLNAYGTFWIRRFEDAWESCSHKKAVAFGIFSLVWNLSSVIARIWAIFLLFVVFKFYQQWKA